MSWLRRVIIAVTLIEATLILAASPGPDPAMAVYSAVVEDVRETLRGVQSVRVIVAATTETLTTSKLERLASAGPKDDPPNALALAKNERGFGELVAANSSVARVRGGKNWTIAGDRPVSLRCSGLNWETERDVFIRFSRPVFVGPRRALVYAFIKDCISFGHDIVVLEKRGGLWKPAMSYQIAGAGE